MNLHLPHAIRERLEQIKAQAEALRTQRTTADTESNIETIKRLNQTKEE